MDNQSYLDDELYTEDDELAEKPKKGKSIAALILGILSIVANLPLIPLPFAWVIGLVSCIISKVLAKKSPDGGLKKGAKITSTIGLVMTIIWATLGLLTIIATIVLTALGVSSLMSNPELIDFLIDFIEEILWELGLV